MNNLHWYIRYMMCGLTTLVNNLDTLDSFQDYMISLIGEEIPYQYLQLLSMTGDRLDDYAVYTYRRYYDTNTVKLLHYRNVVTLYERVGDDADRNFEVYKRYKRNMIVKEDVSI